jgi:hypothetical protein
MSLLARSSHCSPDSRVWSSVDRIKVMLGDMPRMLRELIGAAVRAAPDMSLVEDAVALTPDASSSSSQNADVMIVSVSSDTPAAQLESLLYARPHMTLLAIGQNGRATTLYELRPHRVALGDVSPQVLVDAIRGAVHAKVR